MSGDEPEDTAEATGSADASETDTEAELQRIREEAAREAVSQARARCKAIFDSAEAKDRDVLAKHLAFNTEIAAEDAIAILRASPLVEPVTRKSNGHDPGAEFAALQARSAAGGATS